jgi:hypothetical protein
MQMPIPTTLCRVLKYVPHPEVLDHLRTGWDVLADLGPAAREFRVLMGWRCACRVVIPVPEGA